MSGVETIVCCLEDFFLSVEGAVVCLFLISLIGSEGKAWEAICSKLLVS